MWSCGVTTQNKASQWPPLQFLTDVAGDGAPGTGTPASTVVVPRLRDPEAFYGTEGADVEDWLEMYERVSSYNKCDPTVRVTNIVVYLGEQHECGFKTTKNSDTGRTASRSCEISSEHNWVGRLSSRKSWHHEFIRPTNVTSPIYKTCWHSAARTTLKCKPDKV